MPIRRGNIQTVKISVDSSLNWTWFFYLEFYSKRVNTYFILLGWSRAQLWASRSISSTFLSQWLLVERSEQAANLQSLARKFNIRMILMPEINMDDAKSISYAAGELKRSHLTAAVILCDPRKISKVMDEVRTHYWSLKFCMGRF